MEFHLQVQQERESAKAPSPQVVLRCAGRAHAFGDGPRGDPARVQRARVGLSVRVPHGGVPACDDGVLREGGAKCPLRRLSHRL